ncbi:MAG: hypothetical protein ACXVDF_05510, partial [Ktedonobacterales bacterium]
MFRMPRQVYAWAKPYTLVPARQSSQPPFLAFHAVHARQCTAIVNYNYGRIRVRGGTAATTPSFA